MKTSTSTPTADLVQRTGSNVVKTDDKEYFITEKYKLWEELFLDEKNKETFGNQTRSAIIAYNLDEKTQYNTAVQIGHQNIKKHRDIMRKFFAKKGWTYGRILEVYIEKMFKSPNPDMLYSLAKAVDYPLPEYKPITNPLLIKQYNTQINNEGGVSVYGNLNDDQLSALIASKGAKTGDLVIIDGEGTTDQTQPAEVHEDPLQTIQVSDK